MTGLRRILLTGLAIITALLISAGAASADATYTVTTTASASASGGDCATTDTNCSLGQALYAADQLGVAVTIIVPAGTYLLGYNLYSQNNTITLTGAGAASTIIDASGLAGSAALDVNSGSLTVSGVTIQNGSASGVVVAGGASATFSNSVIRDNSTTGDGGGIQANGNLTLDHDLILDNSANANLGGGLNAAGTANRANRVVVTDTTFRGDEAEFGGAMAEDVNGTMNVSTTLTITGSLMTNNTGNDYGGAFQSPDAASGDIETMTMSDSTVEGNVASDGYGGGLNLGDESAPQRLEDDTIVDNTATYGGDIAVGTYSPTIQDTIVAGGSATTGPDCDDISTMASLTSFGDNLDDQNGCGFRAGLGDLINTNPKLGPLADNGGATETMAPSLTSPVIDAGGSSCQATDQRGVTAPQGAACDIGAYESAPASIAGTDTSGVSSSGATVDASVANPDAASATVTVRWGTSAGAYPNPVGSQSAAPLTGATSYAFVLSGLAPATVYHYQVTVAGARGTVTSTDESFTTAAATTTTTTAAGPTPTTTTPDTTTTTSSHPPSNRFTVTRLRVTRTGRLTATLAAADAGTFRARASFRVRIRVRLTEHGKRVIRNRTVTHAYGTATLRTTHRGTRALSISMSRLGAAELRKLRALKVTLAISFTPSGGHMATKQRMLTVRLSRAGVIS